MILCHGLSATRRYVVHGSRFLPRKGFRLITFDARGHGLSEAASEYNYAGLGRDLGRVIDSQTGSGPLIAGGHSMGCHTVARRWFERPEGIQALIFAGPVFLGAGSEDPARWDARAEAMIRGPEAFADEVSAGSPAAMKDTIWRIARDRARLHAHPEAVADALRQIPRSSPFESAQDLARIDVPVLIVGSRDEFDPGHPLAVAETWAETIPGAELICEEEGESPLAWQGGRLSRAVLDFLVRHGLAPVG